MSLILSSSSGVIFYPPRKSHADSEQRSQYLTQIHQIYPIRLSNRLPAKKRSEGTKAEAKLRLIARGERSVTPGPLDRTSRGIWRMRKRLLIK